jgi:hypothetical protein
MHKATEDEWNRYYQGARRRRHETGADPLERFLEQRETHERRIFIASSLLLAAMLAAFYAILIR